MKINLRQVPLWYYTILLSAVGMFSYPNLYANNPRQELDHVYLSIKIDNRGLDKIFTEIETKTKYRFTYRRKVIEKSQVRDSVMTNRSLGDVLRYISRETGLSFKQIDKNIFVTAQPSKSIKVVEPVEKTSSSITVKGKVTSKEEGIVLPGVSVAVRGGTTGTTVDEDGNYSLVAPDSARLVFSFVGFVSEEIAIGNRTVIDVELKQDITQLLEIVVTGYATQTKTEITGALSTVRGSEFEDLPVQSLDKAMQGRASGVQINSASGQPGGAVDFKIRGVGSYNASNAPLIIIDGVQMIPGILSGVASTNVLAMVNPNDIESIEILKDASASAIYGAQGANGVVLITTQKGRNTSGEITFSSQVGIVKPTALYDMLSARELAQLRYEALENAGKDPTSGFGVFGDPNDPNLKTTNWIDAIFRTGKSSLYNLSYRGGDDKTQYYLSGSFNKQEGHIINTDWSRYTFQFNMTSRPIPRLLIEPKILLSVQESNGTFDGQYVSTNPVYLAVTSLPSIPVYDELGNYTNYGALSGTGQPNAVQAAKEIVRNIETLQSIASLQLGYELFPSLTLTGFGGVNVNKPRSLSSFPSTMPLFASTGGQKFRVDQFSINFNTNATLNYKQTFGVNHNVNFLAGTEYKSLRSEYLSVSVQGFVDPSFSLVQSASTISGAWEGNGKSVRIGFFGKTAYNFKHKYFADFTLRRDGSSRFSPGKRFGNFYSGGLAWRLSEENFLKQNRLINNLKIRGSYGLTGNSEIGDFQYLQVYNTSSIPNYYQNSQSITLNRPEGLPFGWEESLQSNLGLDVVIWNSRISGVIDFWRKDNRSLLFNKQLPIDAGFDAVLTNVGKIRNQGIDIELSTINVLSGNFRWSSNLNLTFQKNELLELPDGADRLGNSLIVGEPLDFLWGAEYAGVDSETGKPMWYDKNGERTYRVQDEDLKVIGDRFPDYFGGVSNTFSYKGFSLDIFFQFQGGLVTYTQELDGIEASGSNTFYNQLRTQLNRWQKPGDVTNVPRPYDGGAEPGSSDMNILSTKLLSDGSYLKLKQVTLAYDFPAMLLSRAGIKNARLYLQGFNLHTFTKSQSLDPEVVAGATPSNNLFVIFPTGQQYTMGVTLTF